MKTIDISGNWNYALDPEDAGIQEKYYEKREETRPFHLPGTTCEHQLGQKQEWYEELNRDTVRAPREKYEYVGPLWLWREVEVPEEFRDQIVTLFLERVNVSSQAWIDGKAMGREVLELSAPHQHVLNGITPGKHVITLRLDNRNLLDLDGMSSGYSVDTQGFWNGVIGKLELRAESKTGIRQIQIYPKETGIRVRVLLGSTVYSPFVHQKGQVEARVVTPDGEELPLRTFPVELFNSTQPFYFEYEIPKIRWWSEFHPDLYRLELRYLHSDRNTYSDAPPAMREEALVKKEQKTIDERCETFGMRLLRADKQRLLLNGRGLSLRGTTNCAIFPRTGYPEMGKEFWTAQMKLLKEYGLNHLRFHAWCPPESAFEAADEWGIYLSVEMPLWLNHDVCALELGEDPLHRSYFLQEGNVISRTYGNHPSFLFFSNGNENMGDFSILEENIIQLKAMDPRRLYTLTTNFDHPVLPCEDYFCAYEADGKKLRIEHLHEAVGEHTCVNYEEAVEHMPIPVMSFEVGQYCVYPDVSLIEKYDGNMLPVNLDVIEKDMKAKKVRQNLKNYIQASGDLAKKLYKEDIEALLRTRGLGGFGLLSLQDYTGQCTATVGMLDIFGNSKGIVTPEEFRRFCGPAVPLLMTKRIYTSDEKFTAELRWYDYREEPNREPCYCLKLFEENRLFAQIRTKENRVEIDLSSLRKPTELTVVLQVEDYENRWKIFVYPSEEEKVLPVISEKEALQKCIEEGRDGIISADLLKHPVAASFLPVFWSPAFFKDTRSCGAMIQKTHPIFEHFPTVEYSDYQWKKLLTNCKGVDLRELPENVKPIVETVPNFMDNLPGAPLLELCVGKSRLLICGLSLTGDAPEITCMRNALRIYLESERFAPEVSMDPGKFMELF